MRRRALIFLLAAGTIAGYGSGFASLARWHRYGSGGYCHPGRSYYEPRTAPSWAPSAPPAAPAPQAAPPPAPAAAPEAPTPSDPG